MKNLAGVDPSIATKECQGELEKALLSERSHDPGNSEVKSYVRGEFAKWFNFRRNWYYWVATGPVPLFVARKIFDDPVGKTDIRAQGDCSCIDPVTRFDRYAPDGRLIIPVKNKEEFDRFISSGFLKSDVLDQYHFSDDPVPGEVEIVDTYHIDSLIGLRVFRGILFSHLHSIESYVPKAVGALWDINGEKRR